MMSAATLGFVLGAMVGGTLGAMAMAILVAGKDEHDS